MPARSILRPPSRNFWKVFGSYLLLILLATTVAWLVGSRALTKVATQRIEEDLEHQAYLLRELIVPRLREGKTDELQQLVTRLRLRVQTRFTIVSLDGVVLADSDEVPARMDNHGNRPEIVAARVSGRGAAIRRSVTEQKDLMYVALFVAEEEKPLGFVRAALPMTSVEEKVGALRTALVAALLASLAAALIASVAVSLPLDLVKGLREAAAAEKERRESLEIQMAERERAAQERKLLIDELEKKNAELERYTYTVSHDLKSPLITIKGFLGYLEKDAVAGNFERFRTDLERVGAAADRMGQLLDDLLELSRVGRIANPPEQVALADLAAEAVQLLSGPIAARGVQVTIAPDLPVVRADRVRLGEVFQNLVENAVKFMGEQPHPEISIGVRHDNGETVCFVRDNGIGIEAQYQQKVFGLFDKLNKQSEGTGIGLALVQRIVEVHGGRIWIESEGPGKGAAFCFTLSAAHSAGDPTPEPGKSS
jgi:signal transduction histidine kinase